MPTVDDILKNKQRFKKKSTSTFSHLDTEDKFISPSVKKYAEETRRNEDPILVKNPAAETIERSSSLNSKKTVREQQGESKGTTREQQGNSKGTTREQQGNSRGTKGEQQGNSRGTDWGTTREQQVREQQGNNKGTVGEQFDHTFSLVGHELNITFYLFETCQILGTKITPKLTNESIAKSVSIASKEVVKTVLKRLVKKEIINREKGKKGNGGWIKFSFNENKYQQIFHLKENSLNKGTIREQQGNNKGTIREQQGNNKGTDWGTNTPSSSNTIYSNTKKETTTNESSNHQENIFDLPENWTQIDFFGLNEKIKFGMQQLKNICSRGHLTSEQCENSLESFSHDLENNLVTSRKTPLQFLMGILLKGEYFSTDKNFKTEEETEREKQLRAKIDKANAMRAMEAEAKEASFYLWMQELPIGAKDQILAKLEIFGLKTMAIKEKAIHLKNYYMETIWPQEFVENKNNKVREGSLKND